jgi:hypothetical protein
MDLRKNSKTPNKLKKVHKQQKVEEIVYELNTMVFQHHLFSHMDELTASKFDQIYSTASLDYEHEIFMGNSQKMTQSFLVVTENLIMFPFLLFCGFLMTYDAAAVGGHLNNMYVDLDSSPNVKSEGVNFWFFLPFIYSAFFMIPKANVLHKAQMILRPEHFSFLEILKSVLFILMMHLFVFNTVQIDLFYGIGMSMVIYA